MEQLKLEIAAQAARLIADSGLDYGSAKRKAAQSVWGRESLPRDSMPDNETVDLALLEHLELFDEAHPARVRRMRRVALEMMDRLAAFQTYVAGAAWKGICAEHAYVHLQVFHDNPKEVEYALIDQGLPYEAGEAPHWRGDADTEALALLLPFEGERVPVLIALYDSDQLRGALKVRLNLGQAMAARGDRKALAALLADPPPADPAPQTPAGLPPR